MVSLESGTCHGEWGQPRGAGKQVQIYRWPHRTSSRPCLHPCPSLLSSTHSSFPSITSLSPFSSRNLPPSSHSPCTLEPTVNPRRYVAEIGKVLIKWERGLMEAGAGHADALGVHASSTPSPSLTLSYSQSFSSSMPDVHPPTVHHPSSPSPSLSLSLSLFSSRPLPNKQEANFQIRSLAITKHAAEIAPAPAFTSV